MSVEKPAAEQGPSGEAAGAPERPLLITVACAVGVLGALRSVPVILSDFASGIGAWYAPYIAASVIASLVCIAGLWKMRRWSLFLYAGIAATNQLVVYSMGIWHFYDLLLPAAFLAMILPGFRKMR